MATARMNNPVAVNFACQRCSMPLRLDHSLLQLNEQNLAELSDPVMVNSENDDTMTMVGDRSRDSMNLSDVIEMNPNHMTPIRLTESGNGFTLVGESTNKEMESFSYLFKVTSGIFDILSDQSDVDHPLCEECTDALLDQMDQQLKVTEDEYKDYKEFLERLQQPSQSGNLEELERELRELKEEEASLRRHLQQAEERKGKALTELQHQKEEGERLESEEEHYWQEYCNYKRQLLLYEDEQRSVDNQLKYAQAQLNKLKKTNVFNATFHIWHSGHFGTINNFRLGRLPNVPVEWHEINAAWGQTVLLLHSLAKKINLTFQRYRLVPYGNHSYLECLTDKSKELPLYGSGGIRFFWDTKFDQAMVAFLDCLQQFKEEVEKGDTGFSLPYKMEKGKIEDGTGNSYSIKIQFNSEEQWTKALKFMLTNLKWGLAWVSSQFATK